MEIRTVDGRAYGPVASITVGASPFTWANPEAARVRVFVTNGTLSTVQLSPDVGVTWADVGLSCGHYDMNPGWQLKLSYILAPTMTYTPF